MSGDVIPAGPKRPPHTVTHKTEKKSLKVLVRGSAYLPVI